MLIFGVRRLLSLKNCQMGPQTSFLQFSLKIQLFSKKLLNKKIFSIKFLIKKAIFNFGVGWPAPFNLYLYGPKYQSSDALPAPEIFFCSAWRSMVWYNQEIDPVRCVYLTTGPKSRKPTPKHPPPAPKRVPVVRHKSGCVPFFFSVWLIVLSGAQNSAAFPDHSFVGDHSTALSHHTISTVEIGKSLLSKNRPTEFRRSADEIFMNEYQFAHCHYFAGTLSFCVKARLQPLKKSYPFSFPSASSTIFGPGEMVFFSSLIFKWNDFRFGSYIFIFLFKHFRFSFRSD